MSPATIKRNYENLMDLHEAADYYEMGDLHAETARALRSIMAGVKEPHLLTWMGRHAHEHEDVAMNALLWEFQNVTRLRILEIMRDSDAWSNVYANEECIKKVTCGLAGCDDCRRAQQH